MTLSLAGAERLLEQDLCCVSRTVFGNGNLACGKTIQFCLDRVDDVDLRSLVHRLFDAQIENRLAFVGIGGDQHDV